MGWITEFSEPFSLTPINAMTPNEERIRNQAITGTVITVLINAVYWSFFFFSPHSYLTKDIVGASVLNSIVQIPLLIWSIFCLMSTKRTRATVVFIVLSFFGFLHTVLLGLVIGGAL